jgi:alcohol dehydrogenase (NADP+)
MHTLTLQQSHTLPAFGLGTWNSPPGDVQRAVTWAIEAGYRHIDCAWIYGNEAEIGAALKDVFARGIVTRDELWITSKLWNHRHLPADVEPAIRESLDALGLERLDLYLVHWPVAHKADKPVHRTADDFYSLGEVPLADTWRAMEALVDAGLTRAIGVSNFSVAKLDALLASARIAPAMNQIEMHPYLQQPAMMSYCKDKGIGLTAYSPLGSRDRPARLKSADDPILLEDPVINAIASTHGVSPAQVLIAWALQRGTAVIPKSTNAGRIQQNLDATAVVLTDDDMQRIAGLDRHRRYVDGNFWVLPGGPYTLANLWDE